MAAFNSVSPPDVAIKNLPGFEEDGDFFYHLLHEQLPLQNPELDVRFYGCNSQAVDHGCMVNAVSDNELSSFTKKQSTKSSSMVDKLECGEQVDQKLMTRTNPKRKSSLDSAKQKDDRDGRNKKPKIKSNYKIKEKEHKKPETERKNQKKNDNQEAPRDYIHVRARRGQATDSHSLAERVRREKISERMNILQRLVPGCDKITGKALMLDEIINYVRSLQNQVEILSLKLASVDNLFYDLGMDLDALVIGPQELSSLASSQRHTQQFTPSPFPPITFAHATTATTTSTTMSTTANATATATFATADYPHIDTSLPLLLQGQSPSVFFIRDTSGSLMWDAEEERQKCMHQTRFTNNLGSYFH